MNYMNIKKTIDKAELLEYQDTFSNEGHGMSKIWLERFSLKPQSIPISTVLKL